MFCVVYFIGRFFKCLARLLPLLKFRIYYTEKLILLLNQLPCAHEVYGSVSNTSLHTSSGNDLCHIFIFLPDVCFHDVLSYLACDGTIYHAMDRGFLKHFEDGIECDQNICFNWHSHYKPCNIASFQQEQWNSYLWNKKISNPQVVGWIEAIRRTVAYTLP